MAEIGALAQATEEEDLAQAQQLPGSEEEGGYLSKYQESAEESRQALREARERIVSSKYDQKQKWLAAAQALGSPTRTGQFGETLGNLAGALQQTGQAEQEFNTGKEGRLSDLDQQLSKLNQEEALNMHKSTAAGSGENRGYAQRFFEDQLKHLTPEEQEKAIRVQLGLAPREVGSAELTTVGDPDLQEDVTSFREDVKERTKFAEMTGSSRAGAIDQGFKMVQSIDSNMRTMDKAIFQLENGAQTGVIDQYIPSIRAASVELDQIQKELGLDVIGSVTFGALSKGELDLALATALPTGLNEKQLLNHLRKKKAAQASLQKYYIRQMEFLDNGGTITGFIRKERKRDTPKEEEFRGDGWIYYTDGTKKKIAEKAEGGRIGFQEGGYVEMSEEDLAKQQARRDIVQEDLGSEEELPPEDTGLDELLARTGEVSAGAAVGAGGAAGLQDIANRLDTPRLTEGSPAERKVVEAMEMGGTNPAEVMQDVRRGQRLGVPQTPQDVGGAMTRELGKQAMITGGPDAEAALEGMEERHAGSRERVAGQIENKFKAPEFFAEEDKLTNRLYENAKPAYEKAWKENPALDHPPFWKRMMDNKYGEQAVHMALDFMDDIAEEPIGKKNIAGWVEKPSLKFLDQVKRGFDQMIRKEENMGATPLGKHLRKMRGTLVNWLDDPENTTPAYQEARKQYKGDLEVLEALDTGRSQYLSMPTEEAKRLVTEMPWAEKNALRAGVTQKLYEQLEKPSSDMDAARRILGSPGTTKKLDLLFEKPKEAEIFKAALRREMEMFHTGKQTARSARTGRTGRMVDEFSKQGDAVSIAAKAAGKLTLVGTVLNFFDRKNQMSAEEADEIIKILNEGDNAELQKLETRLTEVASSRRKTKLKPRTRGKAAAVGAGVGAALAAFGPGLFDEEEDAEMEGLGQFLEQQQ